MRAFRSKHRRKALVAAVVVNLVGTLNHPGAAMRVMEHHGMPPAMARHALDGMVEQQAVMLATNHIFLVVGITVIALRSPGRGAEPRAASADEVAVHHQE